MSTDHERALNRAKQKRFQERHPGYQRELEKKRRANKPPQLICTGNYRTFELCDPLDSTKFPRVIAYCDYTTKPVWAKMWAVRDYSKSAWAKWFRALDKMRLEPEERESPWNVGVIHAVSEIIAAYAVRSRLRRVKMLAGDSWLLRSTFSRVAYLTPQTGVVRFDSIQQAAQEIGAHRDTIRKYVAAIKTLDGRTWFDD